MDKVYTKGWLIVSSDNIDDEKEPMRCGRCELYINQENEWIGVTCFHLFTNTWNSKIGYYDKKANVIGKLMYCARWLTDKREDITSDRKIITPEKLMGIVMDALPEENVVKVLINQDFDLKLPDKPCKIAKEMPVVGEKVYIHKVPTGVSNFDHVSPQKVCQFCGKGNPPKQCAVCKHTKYCGRECQRNDWRYHKTRCIK